MAKQDIKNVTVRSFLNRDRNSLRASLLQYARTFFPDRIKDFSDPALGGLLLDFAANVGDVMSYYLDHQFTELDAENAIESKNIQRHLRVAGVPITGASPAVVAQRWAIEVPAEQVGSTYRPQMSALPVILQGSTVESEDGITFELTEDLDFSSTDASGKLKAKMVVGSSSTAGNPITYIMSMGGPGNAPRSPDGICVSGIRAVETFAIPNSFQAFREIILANRDVTQIISVSDSDGNVYYEVTDLSQDTVFRSVPNVASDDDEVDDVLEIIPAPYRFVTSVDFDTRITTLRFGSGNAATLNDDIIPDPSELALPLYGKKTFSRFTLDPGSLLATQTLGVSPVNTTLTVVYRHGGGLSHNVAATALRTIGTLRMVFPNNPSSSLATQVRASVSTINETYASGGEDALTLDELRDKIPASRNAQSRIVSKPDMIARVYMMPSNFGRVFRASVRSNPQNPLAAQLFIISRNAEGQLIVSPDTLKKNLRIFLNQYRMITDAIDILDAQVINIGVEFKVSTDVDAIKNLVIQDIITKLRKYFDVINFSIDKPISLDDIHSIIYRTQGVQSVIDVRFKNISGVISGREYSAAKYDVNANIKKRLLIGPPGSIFEVKHPSWDIVGSAL